MTILFEEDWRDEKGNLRAIAQYETKNRTFARMSYVLQNMGVKNHKFMLGLYDPDLRDVDPHKLDDHNDPDYKLRYKAFFEVRRNVYYFLREVVRVESQGGDPVMFELNRSSIAMSWCFMNGIDYIGIQPRQTGKEQPLDAQIKVPGGWKAMGDMQAGDPITAPDGSTTFVRGVYPQGKKAIYRVRFEDGRWTDCGLEHLWKVHNRYWKPDDTQWRVITLREIMERMEKHPNSEARLSVPLIEPEQTPDVDLPVDPYVIGALLGNGTMTHTSIGFTTADVDTLDELARCLPDSVSINHLSKYDYNLIDSERDGSYSKFIQKIEQLGMRGKRSYEKTIPACYMNASASQRLSLLQGLMDTDGTADLSGSMQYSTSSEQMADQIQFLVRGLGGICKKRTKIPTYTYKGEKRTGRPSYILNIRMRNPKSMFRLARKRDRLSDNYKSADTMKLGIVGVDYIGDKEAQCIEVDHPEHLYITDDYIVTHNTVCALALTVWTIFLCGENITYGMYTKDDDLRQTNINRIKTFRANLPSYMVSKSRSDRDNAKGLFYDGFKNTYETIVAQADKREANKKGRGASAAGWHNDEGAFCKNIRITYSAMLSATNRARMDAKRNDKPHSNILTTTAGDPSLPEGKFMKELVDQAVPWTERFLDLKNRQEFHKVVFASSKRGLVNGTFSHIQLGYTNAWLRDIIHRNSIGRDELARDYLNMWTSLASNPVISKELMARIYKSRKEADYVQILDDYVLYWYRSFDVVESRAFKDKSMILGMDSSDMIGKDGTSFVLIDPCTLETLATFHCTEGNINGVGLLLAQLMLKYRNMIFVPENRSTGSSIIDTVSLILGREGISPFRRIFNNVVNDPSDTRFTDMDIDDPNLSMVGAAKKQFGIKTNNKKRAFLYGSVFNRAVAIAADKIHDATLIRQLASLEVVNARIDHTASGHDDAVVAWLMACWFVFEAKNFRAYGLNVEDVLPRTRTAKSAVEEARLREQDEYLLQLQVIDKRLSMVQDPVVRDNIMNQRRVLLRKIDPTAIPVPETAEQLRVNPDKFMENRYSDNRPVRSAEDLLKIANSFI